VNIITTLLPVNHTLGIRSWTCSRQSGKHNMLPVNL